LSSPPPPMMFFPCCCSNCLMSPPMSDTLASMELSADSSPPGGGDCALAGDIAASGADQGYSVAGSEVQHWQGAGRWRALSAEGVEGCV
jgi:hypothetical protein